MCALPGCSRCTGYRPILDAFKVFAKVEAGAYTEEAIAASKAVHGVANGHSASEDTASGDAGRGVDGKNPKVDLHKKAQKVELRCSPAIVISIQNIPLTLRPTLICASYGRIFMWPKVYPEACVQCASQ